MTKLARLPIAAPGRGGIWPTPGQELLLQASLLEAPEASAAWRRWQEVEQVDALDQASWKLLPLAYLNLTRLGVHDPLLEEARLVFRHFWARNQVLFHRTGGFLDELKRLDIPVIVLKGVALAHLYYPDPGARPMEDLDLLVPLDRFSSLGKHLAQQGWREGRDYDFIYFNQDTLPSFEFVRQDGFSVDLHGHVLHHGCTRDADAPFWARAKSWNFQGHPTLTLCAEDHFFHVVAHGVRWNPVPPCRWMADAWWILRGAGPGFQWERVIEQARFQRSAAWIFHGLERMQKIVPIPLPAGFLPELAAVPATLHRRVEFALDLRPEPLTLTDRIRCLWQEMKKEGANAPSTGKMASLRSYLLEAWDVSSTFVLPFAAVIMLVRYAWDRFKFFAETRPRLKFVITPLRAAILLGRRSTRFLRG